MRGDFVLYQAKKGDPIDWVISWFTKGPYVHCEIDLGNGNFVGEHGTGITVHPRDIEIPGAYIHVDSINGQAGIDKGMRWVDAVIAEDEKDHTSHTYGWRDIVLDVLQVLGRKITFQKKGSWDCSHFVVLYLIEAGAAGPLGSMANAPETVSPNDLARAYSRVATPVHAGDPK